MLSPLRNRFGIPGVISVIALVFAMLGGAYAASNSSGGKDATASAKAKKGPRGPRGPQGPAGADGAQGPQGLPGANGKDGTNGTNGTNGAPGKSVTVTLVDPGEIECNGLGGAIVKQEGAASGTEVCNGEEGVQGPEGDPWTAGGTLPLGETETGAWAWNAGPQGQVVEFSAIEFNIPLAAPLAAAKVHYSTDANFADFDGAGAGTEGCTGTSKDPTAPIGHLCVYKAGEDGAPGPFHGIRDPAQQSNLQDGASTAGALIAIEVFLPGFGSTWGTWAVTGFTPPPPSEE
jgi:hypothetical protein